MSDVASTSAGMYRALSQVFGRRSRGAHLVACAFVVVSSAAYVAPLLLQGWIPFDEGTLAQSAHRVLLGQLPHRDFDEAYTGGLSYAHAIAFRVLGENLVSLRLVLFAAILLAMPAFYYIASRFARPVTAAILSFGILVTSFPSYPAAMPSWYNLIFAVLGCAAMLRYVEIRTRRWVFAAGVFGGLSVLVKIVGVYFILAVLVFLIFDAFAPTSPEAPPAPRSRAGAALVSVVLAIVAAAPFVIMRGRFRLAESIELGLPVVAICMCVALEVWRGAGRAAPAGELAALVSTGWPFAIGVLIPLVCLLTPYAIAGALPALYRGLLVLPQRRLDWTARDGPPLITMLFGLPPLYLLLSRRFSSRALRWYGVFLVVAVEAGLVLFSAFNLTVAASLWSSVRMAAPLVAVAGAGVVALSRHDGRTSKPRREQLLLLVSIAAWCALIQFPTDSYQYFLYALPLFVLAAAALATVRGTLAREIALPTLGAYLVLGLLLRPVFMAGGGSDVVLNGQPTATLDIDRGGLIVRRRDRDDYARLVALIQQHSRSSFIFVSPDAPEVYFLAARENPTRTLFDFFDDPYDRTSRVLAAIRDHHVEVVVINNRPRFSGDMPQALRDSLTGQFAVGARIGRFEVRWR